MCCQEALDVAGEQQAYGAGVDGIDGGYKFLEDACHEGYGAAAYARYGIGCTHSYAADGKHDVVFDGSHCE